MQSDHAWPFSLHFAFSIAKRNVLFVSVYTQTSAELLKFNTARIRDVELLTGLVFLHNHQSPQTARRIAVSATDTLW